MKILICICLILVVAIIILIFVLRSLNKKIKSQRDEIYYLEQVRASNENRIKGLEKEVQIEKKYNKKLVEKMADISSMSIDDVLRELQNNEGGREDYSLCSGD